MLSNESFRMLYITEIQFHQMNDEINKLKYHKAKLLDACRRAQIYLISCGLDNEVVELLRNSETVRKMKGK